MKKINTLVFIIFFIIPALSAQETEISRKDALNIYIDCNWCDLSHFKENFTIVNYVRDRKVADVHIIITEMETGGGGIEYSLFFLGQNKYKAKNDTIVFSLPADYSDDEERESQLKHIQLGLVQYILKTPFADKLNLNIEKSEDVSVEEDPWKHWVFEAEISGYLDTDDNYSNSNFWSSLSATKVTEKIKFISRFNFRYNESKFQYEEDNVQKTFKTISRGYGNYSTFSYSIGDHWAVGGYFVAKMATYSNLQLQLKFLPGFEYNVFKYSEASRKQLRFLYTIGYLHNDYIDTTIYNKLNEGLFRHSLQVQFKYITKWGSINAALWRSNYLKDWKLSNTGAFVGGRVRLFKGLSLRLYGGASFPRNQIQLSKSELSTEDILLRQHELQTNFSIWANFGFSYTIGSIYNNIVNPRFDE